MVPTRRVPSGSGAVRTASFARSAALMISPASCKKACPGAVRLTDRPMRSNSGTPSSVSSWRICTVTAD